MNNTLSSSSLSLLEQSVIQKLLSGDLPELTKLRFQVELCTVIKRELTGFGFYTTFNVSGNIPRTSGLDFKFGDVHGEIEGLSNGAGFLLYVKDGILDMLEGYSYDEPWPPSIGKFKLTYMRGEGRDLALKSFLAKINY